MAFEPPKLVLTGSGEAQLPTLGRVVRDPLAFWPDTLLETGVVQTRAGRGPLAFVSDPQAISTILMNRTGDFPRAPFQDRILGASYGENLIQADQADWRGQRRAVAQPITADRAAGLVPRLELAATDMLEEWAALGADQPVALLRDTRRLSLDALHRSMFADAETAGRRDPGIDETARTIAAMCPVELKQELTHLHPLAEQLARGWKGSCEGAANAKDLNTLTLFLHAGHDNVAVALGWMLWLVAHRPDLQGAVRKEAARRTPGTFSPADYPVAGAVVRETLRLYPPILQLMRKVDAPLPVGDATLEPGSVAVVAIYAMQRHRTLWEQPDAFLPERFLDTASNRRARRAAWLPFGSGPRGCIGSSLALVELALFLAMVCERFTIAPNPDDPLRCHVEWTLRPVGKAPIYLRPRD